MGDALNKVLVIGAGLGATQQLTRLLKSLEPKPAKQLTATDLARLEAAEQRRARRRQRMINITEPVMDHPRPEYETLFWPDMDAYYAEENRARESALREVRRLVRPRAYKDILSYIEDSGSTHSFEIVRTPDGDLQEEREYAFRECHIYQYENGGYTGDSYSGSVCIPLNAGKYLKFHYSM